MGRPPAVGARREGREGQRRDGVGQGKVGWAGGLGPGSGGPEGARPGWSKQGQGGGREPAEATNGKEGRRGREPKPGQGGERGRRAPGSGRGGAVPEGEWGGAPAPGLYEAEVEQPGLRIRFRKPDPTSLEEALQAGSGLIGLLRS